MIILLITSIETLVHHVLPRKNAPIISAKSISQSTTNKRCNSVKLVIYALSFSKFKAQPFGLEQRADLKSLDSVKTLY